MVTHLLLLMRPLPQMTSLLLALPEPPVMEDVPRAELLLYRLRYLHQEQRPPPSVLGQHLQPKGEVRNQI